MRYHMFRVRLYPRCGQDCTPILTRLARLQTHLLQAVSGTVQFEIHVWIDLKREVERVLGTR